MEMTLREVRERYLALKKLENLRLPAKLGYAVSRNLGKLEAEYAQTEKVRGKLCEQYCEKDKDGNPRMKDAVVNGHPQQSYDLSTEGQAALEKDLNELLDEETEVDIRTVAEDAIQYDGERYDIMTVRDMAALAFMIAE